MTNQSPLILKNFHYYNLTMTIDDSAPFDMVGGKFWADISNPSAPYLVFSEVEGKNEDQYYKTTATDQMGRVYWTYWDARYLGRNWLPSHVTLIG